MYTVVHSKKSAAAVPKLRAAGLEGKARGLIAVIREDPYRPPVEKLRGDLRGKWSRRIDLQHRLVYEVFEEEQTVRILSMWSHYED